MSLLLIHGKWNSDLLPTNNEQNKVQLVHLSECIPPSSRVVKMAFGIYQAIFVTDNNEIFIAGTSLPRNEAQNQSSSKPNLQFITPSAHLPSFNHQNASTFHYSSLQHDNSFHNHSMDTLCFSPTCYFPFAQVNHPYLEQSLISSPLIACGPEFGIFSLSTVSRRNVVRNVGLHGGAVNGNNNSSVRSKEINSRSNPNMENNISHYMFTFGWDSKKVFQPSIRNSHDEFGGLLLHHFLIEEVPQDFSNLKISELVCGGDHWFTIFEDRKTVIGKGYNAYFQLGLGHNKDVKKMCQIPMMEGVTIEKASCGLYHSVFITRKDVSSHRSKSTLQVIVCGNNLAGQLAVKNHSKIHNFQESPSWSRIVQSEGIIHLKCEYQSTWIMTENGNLYACGYLPISDPNLSSESSTIAKAIKQRVFDPVRFKAPSSSPLSNCTMSATCRKSSLLACGGFHTLVANHRMDSLIGIGDNTSHQMRNSEEFYGTIPHGDAFVENSSNTLYFHKSYQTSSTRRNQKFCTFEHPEQSPYSSKPPQFRYYHICGVYGSRDCSVIHLERIATFTTSIWEEMKRHYDEEGRNNGGTLRMDAHHFYLCDISIHTNY
ncbi:hypothetical protein C9374_008080 [Naegleria lovaniensis]|uniref:Uncharacterized protein n=1 Tax=Naegleria lovaniensis TaxID=51637 RepID=A0AA88GL06_NAELO|nr:uncharacterized protein C9374_008080 [Naegleria lovaniensis]KAG2378441.1 hypothetical protein C9374_008080 [Naegleria lovaniensis]